VHLNIGVQFASSRPVGAAQFAPGRAALSAQDRIDVEHLPAT